MLKQTLIAGAALVLAATPALAYGGSTFTVNSHSFNTSNKTVTVTKTSVENFASVHNNVFTVSNTGLNMTIASSGKTTSGEAEKGGQSGDVTGGTNVLVSTGDAGSMSTVSNVVNTTTVTQ